MTAVSAFRMYTGVVSESDHPGDRGPGADGSCGSHG